MPAKRGRSISNLGYGLFSGLSGGVSQLLGLVAFDLGPRTKELFLDSARGSGLELASRSGDLLLDDARDKDLELVPRRKELELDKEHR